MSSSVKLKGTRLRLVLDTNVVVSGLLWSGHSRRLLELALSNSIFILRCYRRANRVAGSF